MTIEEIQNELQKKGSDLKRLMAWLQQPKQGIISQVAIAVIAEVCEEWATGLNYHMESLMYPEGLRVAMEKDRVPHTYWAEMYILERCNWAQEDMITGQGLAVEPIKLEAIFEELQETMIALDDKIAHIQKTGTILDDKIAHLTMLTHHIDNMVVPIKRWLSIPPWMKWIGKKIRQVFYDEFWKHLDWNWK